jgi:PAS domain S-box-containing protein
VAEVVADRRGPKFIHPDDFELVERNTLAVLAGTTTTIEHRIITKAGEVRWHRLRSRPGREDEHRQVTRIYAAAQDITTAKQSDEALQKREQGFRLLFESNPHPMWVYDLQSFQFLAVNDAAIKHYGYSRAEFLAMRIPDLLTPEGVAPFAAVADDVRVAVRRTARSRHRQKDGSIIDVQISSHALEFEGHHAAVAVGFDLTEQIRATEALRESEERFLFMAEATGDALYRLRHDTMRYDYLSPAIEQLTGYSAAEIDHEVWQRIARRTVTPEGQNLAADTPNRKRLVGGGISYHAYNLIQTKTGSDRWIEDRSEPWRDQDGNVIGWVGVLSDSTGRQVLEEQLRQGQKMEAIGQLAGGVAHDFNNLLTVIGGYGQLLLVQLDPATIEYSEVEQITQASQSAASLTRQLLAFSRRQVIAPRETDLNAVIEQVSTMLRRLIGEDITYSTMLASQLGIVRADPSQIEQVLMILATNARDAMSGGGRLTIQTRNVDLGEEHVRYHADAQVGPHVMLSVSDSGRGIDEATRPHLFEPFFTTKEFGRGTGLNLAAVYGTVRQSGGSIEVVSEPGEGTTFKIYLPRLIAASPKGEVD